MDINLNKNFDKGFLIQYRININLHFINMLNMEAYITHINLKYYDKKNKKFNFYIKFKIIN